ncbi:MAG: tyrosine-type recombinase/integrase [Desulfobacterales bacterium]|nr:tyrosine-type recombinase/integrase [Desulfobacterales bacterium]
MKNFESFLSPQLNKFIAYRQNLGYSVKPIRSHLLRFDRYVKGRKINPGALQPSFFLDFRNNLKMEPMSINRLLSSVRVFFNFLVRTDYYTENPLRDIPPVPEHSFAPFIFSPEQTDQLIEAVCKRIRKEPKQYLKDLSEYMAIVLLTRCGLRIKEPLRLQPHHYRCRERTIYVEKTKFNKDRLIPVPKSAAAELDNYLAVRNAFMDEDQNPYLLVGNRQKGLNDPRLRFVFNRAVHDIGLDRPRQVIGRMIFASPTPHSLRHSFAVNSLKRIKERGNCPQHALPVLAAYMGHQIYQYTAKYLKFIDAEQRQGLLDFAISHKEDI